MPDRQLPAAAEVVKDAILRRADVPHSIITTRSSSSDAEQHKRLQPTQARAEHRRPTRGPTSSLRQRSSGSSHYRSGVQPLSSDAYTHQRTAAVRSATPSPLSSPQLRHSFRVERAAQTLDRLERTVSDFDVRLLGEKSTTLPKSDGRGIQQGQGFLCGKSGNASDGDEIDAPPGRLSGRKRRTRMWFKNLFRSMDKSSDTMKLFGRKTTGRKVWENYV